MTGIRRGVRDALIVLWEASDRVRGKRLRSLVPVLAEAMERHGHLQLLPQVRADLLAMSAATIAIERYMTGRWPKAPSRTTCGRDPAPRPGAYLDGSDDPTPGFVEADLVAPSGGPPRRAATCKR